MKGKGQEFVIDGVRAWYRQHELDAMRRLSHATDMGAEPLAVLAQMRLLHGLKVELGARLVDEHEEAAIRRDWDAAMTAQTESSAA